MIRSAARSWLVIGLVTAATSVARAQPPAPFKTIQLDDPVATGNVAPVALQGTNVLFLDRCVNGCSVRPGGNDAGAGTSAIATNAAVIQEYAWADGQWEGLVKCMQDVYSPYNVTVTDVQPVGQVYNREIVGGAAADIGADDSCGLAFITGCTPLVNALSFAFTDYMGHPGGCIDGVNQEDEGDPVLGWCGVMAQETAHSYGLDHEYMFSDGMSACKDPLSYRVDCGGEKFFRNQYANCSGNDGQPKAFCGAQCSDVQNSHQQLLTVLGPGTPTTTPPTGTFLEPTGATIENGGAITVSGTAQRGIGTVDFYLNGYKWGTQPGAPFGPDGQPLSSYTYTLGATVPDGVIDIDVKLADDIGVTTALPTVTVTKGAPCADATTCLAGQQCSAGKCFWSAPTGMLGDACTYPQFCTSGECEGATPDKQFCTTDCVPGVSDACDDGYDCVSNNGSTADGFCLPSNAATGSGGGCCSVGGDGVGQIATHGGLAAAVLAMLARRRRRAV